MTRGVGHVVEGSGRGSVLEHRLCGEQGCPQEPEEEGGKEEEKPPASSEGGENGT